MAKKVDCEWYLDQFCCKDLDAARVWDCTAPNRETRLKTKNLKWHESCKYPKLHQEKESKRTDRCPRSIKKGHCDECLQKKLKVCERCNSKNKVEFTYVGDAMFHEEDEWSCICYDCRTSIATIQSLQRSW